MSKVVCRHCGMWCDDLEGHPACIALAQSGKQPAIIRRLLVGAIWMAIELVVLSVVIQLARDGDRVTAAYVGVFLIWLSYLEGRMRR